MTQIEKYKSLMEEVIFHNLQARMKKADAQSVLAEVEQTAPFKFGDKVKLVANWHGHSINEVVFVSAVRAVFAGDVFYFRYSFRRMKKSGEMSEVGFSDGAWFEPSQIISMRKIEDK